MVLVVVRQVRLNCMSTDQRLLRKAKKAKEDHQDRVHLDKMVVVVF
jgi:hypothetical protein